jgi:hypothetical protein
MIYSHATAPDRVFEKHLARDHDKTTSWLEPRNDLRSAHASEHRSGQADHDLDEKLEG